MPAPEERTWLNRFIAMLLQGRDEDRNPQDLLTRRDRSLVVWNRLVGRGSDGEKVVAIDTGRLLRIRPYEALDPVTSVLMGAELTTGYTATGKARVRVEIVNSSDDPSATCSVVRDVDGGSGDFQLVGPTTPVPLGVGILVGHYDLLPGGTIRGSSSPGNSCTLTCTPDQFSATGDSP